MLIFYPDVFVLIENSTNEYESLLTIWIVYANSTTPFVKVFQGRLTRKRGTNCCHVICYQDIIADGANVLIIVFGFDM